MIDIEEIHDFATPLAQDAWQHYDQFMLLLARAGISMRWQSYDITTRGDDWVIS